MRKTLKFLVVVAIFGVLFALTACAREAAPAATPTPAATPAAPVTPAPGQVGTPEVATGDPRLAEHNLDENLRFESPVNLSVAMWDRSQDRWPDFTTSMWADWMRENVYEIHNINVNYVSIPRWDEQEFLTTLLGAGNAPDVSYTFSMPVVETFAAMGAVLDLAPLLAQYNDWLPNLYGLLTPMNVYWNRNPHTGTMWGLAGRLEADGRVNTFIREDWLNQLGIAPPQTAEQFEAALIAFRDNADALLGDNAHMIAPFMLGASDPGWGIMLITESFIPDAITEREWFRYGFDDRRFMHREASFQALQMVNRWYNEGLIWNDFLYGNDAIPTPDDTTRLGFTGSMIANWDMPFRAGDRWITDMRENVGPEANFIVVTPWQNDAGNEVMYMPPPTDRTLFMPSSNQNPVAGLLYLDWISRIDVREFLLFGLEGIHRETLPNGAIRSLGERPADSPEGEHRFPDNMIFGGARNFDLAITQGSFIAMADANAALATLALAYPGISEEAVLAARSAGLDRQRVFRQVVTRTIEAQEGMAVPLNEFRNQLYSNVITAPVADFAATFNRLYDQYLAMGAQAIINERDAAWVEEFGDVQFQPDWPGWN